MKAAGALLGLACSVGAALPASTLAQTNGQGGEEIRLLREAASLEQAGDLAGAEAALRDLLTRDPLALSGLLSLERVLHLQARAEEVIPFAAALVEADPRSAIGHQMLLRSYSAANRLVELARATEAWIDATPKLETPYREAARVWQARGEEDRVLSILERGRARLGPNALALELGDLYAARRDYARAVEEWDRAIGEDADGFLLVRRRLGSLPDGGARLLPALIDELTRRPTTLARRRAAADLAVAAGLEQRAEEVAKSLTSELRVAERRPFLVETARRADGAGLTRLALWAYTQLLADGGPDPQMLAIRSRIAELALTAGDTTRARAVYQELETSYAAGSADRRRAIALRINLTAREGEAGDALRELDAFRQEFPDAPELDALVAATADALVAGGRTAEAERLLGGASGPQSALRRGRLALRRGELVEARTSLLAAAPGLHGAEATETIALVKLLGRVSPAAGQLLGRAAASAAAGEPQEAVALLVGESTGLPPQERAGVLDYAAGLADRTGLPDEAQRIRRTLVVEHAGAAEAAAALLALARGLAVDPAGAAEAQAFLERLILEYPRSALVPQARRELELLKRRIPNS